MRWLVSILGTCLACTRLNPAFDDSGSAGESGADSIVDSSDGQIEESGEESAESSSEEESSTDGGLDDLPGTDACEFEPREGLALAFGDPAYFSGNCPRGVTVQVRVSAIANGEATLSVCEQGCVQCSGEHPLSAFPLNVTDYLPAADDCVMLETSTPLGPDGGRCYWGALSIWEPVSGTPWVIATSHSSPPTAFGSERLGELIPAPLEAGKCSCDEVGQGNDCCYPAPTPPTFWYYPFGDEHVLPGDFVALAVPNQANLPYYFKPFQAQQIHSCAEPERELSWAVVPEI